ncbi:MIS1-C1-tetrahydrofolate synthase precursor mitochondrial [Fusarium subglutinans]|uniref:MIS1-C1-tetrahydrofolate synthase mitochondrial n=1 Tax=Gibberella subglutinans TaxID=42677 RepID=A0A8H5PB06_GIBSU|nr:MIS1-C1-tetrahydrofolate synthase precursor mitochondrial [Fusarium subglutinans]KAF5593397.1 MIS1-C1-tetrahydrofolate synthase precursor mitochondrial [Fusarium subglutinans]
MDASELLTLPSVYQSGSARLLTGDLVVHDIERWCHRKADRSGLKPVMAVLFFNTGPDAVDYVKIKAHVAARAGVDYWVYEMPVDASTIEVMSQVKKLNMNPQIHGILIQRPLPEQLNEAKIMGYIDPVKNIEEYDKGQVDNIAADALIRLLARYGLLESAQQAKIQIAGFGNIITKEFINQMKRQFPYVSVSKDFDLTHEDKHEALHEEIQAPRETMIISELHRGPAFIKESMVKPEVSVLVDLGFYVTEKGVIGDENSYTSTSDIDDDSLKCPNPTTSQEAESRRTQTESKPARWWEGLCPSSSKSTISLEPLISGEEDPLQLTSYPAEAEARTRAIDRYLAAESQRSKRQLKIILFGDEHEKSLFLKQTRLLELPLSNDERANVRVEARRFVASMCRECLQIVDEYACKPESINAHAVLGRVKDIVSREVPGDQETVKSMISLYCDNELRLALKQSGHNLEDIERRFLFDRFPHILTCPCTSNGNLSNLLKRVFATEYAPTEHDWFHFDQRRLGQVVQEALVHRDSHTLQLLQITDRSTQRRKWIHILVDDAACLVFICNMAVYDQSLLEDETTSRLHEDLMLFDSLANSRWFTQTPFFVILSNASAFRSKILQSPLSKWFPQFEGGSDGDAALEFMKDQFRELAKSEQNVYIHIADIHSADGVMGAIETMENTQLSQVLKELGMTPVKCKSS